MATVDAPAVIAMVNKYAPLSKSNRELLVKRIGCSKHLTNRDWHDIARMSYRQVRRLKKRLLAPEDRSLLESIVQIKRKQRSEE